ncbi:hypothetical protein B0H11DRAFT_2048916 [Mycena galericulata]|nr:hypothetical protein B0H11DRAFT_2048916 [Mycena galericulata]
MALRLRLEPLSLEGNGSVAPIGPFPIHQLPSELLVEIFDSSCKSSLPEFGEPSSPEVEICRVAQQPLLQLSQVCSRWHTIALGTPSLWNTIELDSVLWSVPGQIDKFMKLLRSALERGRNFPLDVSLHTERGMLPYVPALALVAAHSARWQTATFGFSLSQAVVDVLSSAKSRLPRLKTLELHIWNDYWRSLPALEIFEAVPRLTDVIFEGPLETISHLPFGQLSSFRIPNLMIEDIPMVVSLLPRFTHIAEVCLEVLVIADPGDLIIHVPPLESPIRSLYLELSDVVHPQHCLPVLASFLGNLTLPHLEELEVESCDYPALPLPWPNPTFLSLCARSSLDIRLKSLQLYDVNISHAELLACLSNLPSLEELAISDHQLLPDDGGADQHLITDTLFEQLTQHTDTSFPVLVPLLRSINCQSLLKFSDIAFLKFVLSRVADRARPHSTPFEGHLCWLPGRHRVLDAAVTAQLDELSAENRLTWRFTEAELEWV